MRATFGGNWLRLGCVALVLACGTDRELPLEVQTPSFNGFDGGAWSEPVNLGAPVNSSVSEFNVFLSPDGHSLYFNSPRPGGVGLGDIWVARRECDECPWAAPVNLTVINTPFTDSSPSISDDGHLLFFASNRPGGSGGTDIWVSRRDDPTDDFGWGPPVNLGPEINSAEPEEGPEFVAGIHPRAGNLYFQRGVAPTLGVDLYVASITRRGRVVKPPTLITELSVAGANDGRPSVRKHGREIYFWSFGPTREGSMSFAGLWHSTRRNVRDPWSPPTLLPIPPNAANAGTIQPHISEDGRTLFFISDRPGGVGGQDIWMSRRVRRETDDR
jgi:hypothetical protein